MWEHCGWGAAGTDTQAGSQSPPLPGAVVWRSGNSAESHGHKTGWGCSWSPGRQRAEAWRGSWHQGCGGRSGTQVPRAREGPVPSPGASLKGVGQTKSWPSGARGIATHRLVLRLPESRAYLVPCASVPARRKARSFLRDLHRKEVQAPARGRPAQGRSQGPKRAPAPASRPQTRARTLFGKVRHCNPSRGSPAGDSCHAAWTLLSLSWCGR